jgi:hypothetical protein
MEPRLFLPRRRSQPERSGVPSIVLPFNRQNLEDGYGKGAEET